MDRGVGADHHLRVSPGIIVPCHTEVKVLVSNNLLSHLFRTASVDRSTGAGSNTDLYP